MSKQKAHFAILIGRPPLAQISYSQILPAIRRALAKVYKYSATSGPRTLARALKCYISIIIISGILVSPGEPSLRTE